MVWSNGRQQIVKLDYDTLEVLASLDTGVEPVTPVPELEALAVGLDDIEGRFVGINLTFDGRIVMTTDHGWVVCLTRDFAEYEAVQLPGAAERAAEHCERMEAERGTTGSGWVRTSTCIDDAGGIYVSSVDHTHKVVWTGARLSIDPADGGAADRHNDPGDHEHDGDEPQDEFHGPSSTRAPGWPNVRSGGGRGRGRARAPRWRPPDPRP